MGFFSILEFKHPVGDWRRSLKFFTFLANDNDLEEFKPTTFNLAVYWSYLYTYYSYTEYFYQSIISMRFTDLHKSVTNPK